MQIGQGVKVVHKSALLKDNIVLLCLRFRHNYTTVFPFDLLWIVYMYRCGIFQNHVPQVGEVYNG